MALHVVATHFKYGIQRPPWQRHELSSVISLSFLYVYGPEAGLLNKCLCLAAALGVTKFIAIIAMNSVTLCCAT